MAADVKRDDNGDIQGVIYRDSSQYSFEVDKRSPIVGRIRVITKSPGGSGSPVDLEPAEAIRAAHDLIDMAGGER